MFSNVQNPFLQKYNCHTDLGSYHSTRHYLQARHAAKEALLNDAVEPYTNREVEGSINLRQNTVAKIIEQGRVTEDEADRLIDNNPITLGAMEVEKVNEWDFKPKVIDVLQVCLGLPEPPPALSITNLPPAALYPPNSSIQVPPPNQPSLPSSSTTAFRSLPPFPPIKFLTPPPPGIDPDRL